MRPSTPSELASPARKLGSGLQLVAVPGVAEQLSAASVPTSIIAVQAKADNGGSVAVGDSAVVATPGAGQRGLQLAPGASVSLPVSNLNKVYVDAEVAGEGVTFTWLKR